MAEGAVPDFVGLPDDIARLAVQRMMTCDVRWRAYDRAGLIWQRTATVLSALAAVVAAVAAISVVQDRTWLAASLSIAVAVIVPLHNSVAASSRATKSRIVAAKFESLANEYERFAQLDLGPPMWSGKEVDLGKLRRRIDELDSRLENVSADAERVKIRDGEAVSSRARANHLVEYLQMENVVVAADAVWRR